MPLEVYMPRYRPILWFAAVGILFGSPFPSAASDPILIASLFSFSGTASATNYPSIQAVRWAVNEINSKGGINGRRLRLLELDNASTPIGSKLATEKAAAANAAAIIGPAYSSHCIAAARVAQQHGIPLVTNIATDPDVTRVGDFIFRVCFSDIFQSKLLARFARQELNAATAIILVNANSDYSLGLAREFRTHFGQMGGRLSDDLYYKDRQDTFDELIRTVKNADPALIFIPGYVESALIAKKLSENGVTTTLLGADGWDIDGFRRLGGDTIRLGYFTTHWVKDMRNKQSREFVNRYGEVQTLTSSSALAYDAVMLTADAIRRAGTADRSAIRRALADTKGFDGITGKISLDADGDPIKPAVIMKISNGQYTYLRQVEP
jgi:branched-chain amino acid transport system substrate-binding protein